jgi:Lysozyme inhibitor LprI
MMRSRLLPTSMVIAGFIAQQALAAQSCDDALMAINTCIGGEVGEITPDQLACLRSVASDAKREMSAAYQRRLQITTASARRDLASVQKLWAQSTQANCKFFNNGEGANRYECLISAMVERKQTLEAND